MNTIEQRLKQVQERILNAESCYGRLPGSVQLLAVSKTWPLADILTAAAAGQFSFGENYVQEVCSKIDTWRAMDAAPALEWHFIGHLQSNKSREIARRCDWVQSVDSEKLARRLSQQRPETLPPLNICLQVNISDEPSKSGVSPEHLADLAFAVADLPRLRFRGLMAIPAPLDSLAEQRHVFARVAQLQQKLKDAGLELDTLSMGMSGDLEAAIAEGATLVRIGSAIFGERG